MWSSHVAAVSCRGVVYFGSTAGGEEPKRGDFGDTWTKLKKKKKEKKKEYSKLLFNPSMKVCFERLVV